MTLDLVTYFILYRNSALFWDSFRMLLKQFLTAIFYMYEHEVTPLS